MMGFRKDAYATVWSVEPVSQTLTKGRISISKKNKETGEYVTDFSGFVGFVGTASASKALNLKERDRIRLGDVDVSNKYDKEKAVTYTNFTIFSFDVEGDTPQATNNASVSSTNNPAGVDNGEPEEEYPF